MEHLKRASSKHAPEVVQCQNMGGGDGNEIDWRVGFYPFWRARDDLRAVRSESPTNRPLGKDDRLLRGLDLSG
jgi:hypothetical protein